MLLIPEIQHHDGARQDHQADDDLEVELPGIEGMDHAFDFAGRGHHCHRPGGGRFILLDQVLVFQLDRGIGHEFLNLSRHAAMPAGDIGARAFLAGQHFFPLNLVDGVEGDGGHPFFAHRKGVFADEVAFRMTQKYALAIHDPGITGFAALDTLGKLFGQDMGIDIKHQHPAESPGWVGMGFVHRHLVGGHGHDGDEPADVVGNLGGHRHHQDLALVFRLAGPLQYRGVLEGAGGDLIHPPAVHLVSPVAVRTDTQDLHHAVFPDGGQGGPHAVGPGQGLQVLDGRGEVEGAQLPFEEVDILLQQAGGIFGQHQLLLVKVFLDDLLHLVGGLEPQIDADPQQGEIDRQQ